MGSLKDHRKKIDRIDRKIAKLLLLRFGAVKRISSIKKLGNRKITDKKRESEVLSNVKKNSKQHQRFILDVFKKIIMYSKKIQK